MTYVVNGEEFSKKSDATKAIYDALDDGDVTVSKPAEVDEDASAPAPSSGPDYIL
jgi:hypothetical protein